MDKINLQICCANCDLLCNACIHYHSTESQDCYEKQIIHRRNSLKVVILCGGMLKIVSISPHMGTDVVRTNFLLDMVEVVITMAICSVVYEAVVRVAPWMVGKKKVKE